MDWESRLTTLWAQLDDLDEAEFHQRMRQLTSELPSSDPIASFELAGAQDSTGHPADAIPLYRAALAAGLVGTRRRRAVIQLASSLRNLGEVDEAIALLEKERARESSELDDAVVAVLALAYSSADRDREGLAIALEALAAHLPRYQRSMTNYARALL